jgi:hypothetical protein
MWRRILYKLRLRKAQYVMKYETITIDAKRKIVGKIPQVESFSEIRELFSEKEIVGLINQALAARERLQIRRMERK